MKALVLILLILLEACSTQQVLVTCVTQVPEKPTLKYSPPYTSVFDGVRDLLGDKYASEAYEVQLEAIVQGCKK